MTAGNLFSVLWAERAFLLDSVEKIAMACAEGRTRKDTTCMHSLAIYAELTRFRNFEMQLWRVSKTNPEAVEQMLQRISTYNTEPLHRLMSQPEVSRRKNLREPIRRLVANIEVVQLRIQQDPMGMASHKFKRSYRYRLGSLFGKAVRAAHKELNSSRLPILYLF